MLNLPRDADDRFLHCDKAFFAEQLRKITELEEALPGSIYYVIKRLLDPDYRQRLLVNEALKTACFSEVKEEDRESSFTALKNTKKLMIEEERTSEEREASYDCTPTQIRQLHPYRHDENKQYYMIPIIENETASHETQHIDARALGHSMQGIWNRTKEEGTEYSFTPITHRASGY